MFVYSVTETVDIASRLYQYSSTRSMSAPQTLKLPPNLQSWLRACFGKWINAGSPVHSIFSSGCPAT